MLIRIGLYTKIIILLSLFLLGCNTILDIDPNENLPKICSQMLGTWYTDITVDDLDEGKKRDFLQINRKPDGSAYIKGISIYYATDEISYWEFSSSWSCKKNDYSEVNDWGKTYFRIVDSYQDTITLLDDDNNFNTSIPIKFNEKRTLTTHKDLNISKDIEAFFGF